MPPAEPERRAEAEPPPIAGCPNRTWCMDRERCTEQQECLREHMNAGLYAGSDP